jgi:hypothetical protein
MRGRDFTALVTTTSGRTLPDVTAERMDILFHGFYPDRFDEKTEMFWPRPMVALGIHHGSMVVASLRPFTSDELPN